VKRFSLFLAAAAAAAVLVPGTAGAAPKESAEILGTVVLSEGGNAATVRARYLCNEPTHLWVSAKQSATGERDPLLTGEGTSAYAAAWLQNHPSLDCDGRNHVDSFVIDNFTEYGFGHLQKGEAWVQFCLTRGESEEDFQLIAYPTRWAVVR
jgi:hypothetical protein